ncbi:MAG: cysteine-rich CWC family protein [Acidobacteriota bacterium]
MKTVSIRPATVQDSAQISALISGVARYFTLHPQGVGAEAFLVSMSADAIAGYIQDPGFHYLVAWAPDGSMAGAAALRSDNHLFHLFVSPAWQRQGVATQLWQAVWDYAREQGRAGKAFSVNATPYAVPFYQRLGFAVSGERVETRGIAFIPMTRAARPSDAQPCDTQVCPLCGGPNGCEPARTGQPDAPCWCTTATFSPELLAQVPAELVGRACICARCAAAQPQTVSTPV